MLKGALVAALPLIAFSSAVRNWSGFMISGMGFPRRVAVRAVLYTIYGAIEVGQDSFHWKEKRPPAPPSRSVCNGAEDRHPQPGPNPRGRGEGEHQSRGS